MKAHEFLERGIEHMKDRAKTYDSPEGERSMGKTVAMFNVLIADKLKEPLSEEDGWNFAELLKLVRSKQGVFKADNYEDRSAYAGLAGEAAYNSNAKKQEFIPSVDESTSFVGNPEPDYWAGIDWPEWAEWRAIDEDGGRFFHASEPRQIGKDWADGSRLQYAGFIENYCGDWTKSLERKPEAQPVKDPMAAIEWQEGMRWMVCNDNGRVHQCYAPTVPNPTKKGQWRAENNSVWQHVANIDPKWAAENWRTSLRENPIFRNDPKTWDVGDVVKQDSTGEVFQVYENNHASKLLTLTNGDIVNGAYFRLVRRSWEPDSNA